MTQPPNGESRKAKKRPVFRIEIALGPNHEFRLTYYRVAGELKVSHQLTGFGAMAQKASLVAEQGYALLRGVRAVPRKLLGRLLRRRP